MSNEQPAQVEGIKAKQAREEREAKEALEAKGAHFVNEGPASPDSLGMGEVQKPTGVPESVRTLVLTFDTANGNFQVAGPIGDKCLCFGMLALAHDEIFKWCEQQDMLKKASNISGLLEP
jgi:hypothetical protein